MYNFIKRIFDIVFALCLLIVMGIPMIIVSIAIKAEDKGPIIYKSKRVGKNLKLFNVYKFRTMRTDRLELEGKLDHDQMVTKVGKVLRKTSIDELPQLFNIIKGEMSFIGPRPWIPEYYVWFTDEQKRRTEVRPGISGLAQVEGRNGINIFKKVEYDLYYVEHKSFILDLKLVIKTIIQVLKKSDAEITEQGIMDEISELKERNNINKNAV